MTTEIWKRFRNTKIKVSTLGNVIGSRGKLINPSINGWGYRVLGYWDNGKKTSIAVCSAVSELFIGKKPKGLQVNHKNGIKTDDRVINLEYVTRSENVKHAFRIGLANHIGEKNSNAKLNEAEVLEIRQLHKMYGTNITKTAQEFGLTNHAIGEIINGKSWRHLL